MGQVSNKEIQAVGYVPFAKFGWLPDIDYLQRLTREVGMTKIIYSCDRIRADGTSFRLPRRHASRWGSIITASPSEAMR
jgi:hypothetical protein